MLGNKLINTNAGGGCTDTVDLYNPFPDGGGVALYQLNGDATDVSGNYDGTATNVTYGAGQFGQAGVFNGSSSKILVPSSPYPLGNSPRTVSCWVKSTNTTANQTLLQYGTGGVNNNFFVFRLNGANNSSLEFSQWGPSHSVSAPSIFDGNFHNVVMTYNGTFVQFYLDGSPLGSTYSASLNTQAGNAGIGAYTDGAVPLNGSIDQVRIFNRALRPYEVEALQTEVYCTPTIVPSEHFNTVTYTGNGNASNTISQLVTGVGFQPDFVWGKNRDNANSHVLFDSVRLPNNWLSTNNTNTQSNTQYTQSSFTSDGFYTGTSDGLNKPNDGFVSWNFKAGGAAVSNTDGTITSQVSANTEAGFSVVKYTGNNSDATIGHGLSSAPEMMIVKNLDNSDATFNGRWFVYHSALSTRTIYLNLTDAATGLNSYPWNSTAPTSTVFSVDSNQSNFDLSILNNNYIAYCFAEVEGFSNFGSYVGTGASGNTIVTGFEPAFLLVKRTDSGDNWLVFDNKRNPSAPVNLALIPNSSSAEQTGNLGNGFTFLENGFNVISTDSGINANGGSYIYMAFAADPTAVEPTLEDSFNTVTYTGNGSTQTIGGVFEGGGSFNGSSSYISTGIDFSSLPDTKSISMWVKSTGSSTIGFGGMDGSSGNNGLFIFDEPAGSIAYIPKFGGYHTASANTVNTNAWNHFVVTDTNVDGNVKIYINGSQVTVTKINSVVYVDNTNMQIGRQMRNTGVAFWQTGSIDQVRIFDTALTAAQVTELYEETDADSSVCNFPSGAGGIALYELNGNANDACGTYNGTASNVTWLNNGTGFQPDFTWIKVRSTVNDHTLQNSISGTSKFLRSNTTGAEGANTEMVTSYDSNGFSLGPNALANQSGQTYVAWAWKGAELPAINSNGSIPSVVSANPAAGFSIVKVNGNNGNVFTFGHGLDVAPSVVFLKGITFADNWMVYTSTTTANAFLSLNQTAASNTNSTIFNNTEPTNEVFTVGTNSVINNGTNPIIAYCFAEVAGFSKFGSYTGNGSTNGPTITTEFEPAFVMVKSASISGGWIIWDNKRNPTNERTNTLFPFSSIAEISGTYKVDFLENGFKIKSSNNPENQNGSSYIYMAFANQF